MPQTETETETDQRMTLRLPPELYRWLWRAAYQRASNVHGTMNDIIVQAVRDYRRGHDDQQGGQ